MKPLALRSQAVERMDDPALPPATYRAVLTDLARVNRWTLAARPTLAFLDRAAHGMARFRLLDVGFGQGDMLRRIARWARSRGIAAELVGVDLNPLSLDAARAATPPDWPIIFHAGDYRAVSGSFDFVISSLVTHHMDAGERIAFLRFMEMGARRGWFVSDLHRHRAAHAGYPLLARALGVHEIVREDGQMSIARGFRPAEWRAMLEEAGIANGAARIVRHFPFRLCVERRR